MSEDILTLILSEIKEMKQEQQKTNIRLETIENRLIKVENRLEKVENRLERVEIRVDDIKDQTGRLSEYHSEVTNKLETLATKDDLIYYDSKIGKHDREIFNIKMKS